MKTLITNLLSMFMVALVLSSCDSNKSKVEELANQFAQALNDNDVATIYDMYPDAKTVSNMKLPKHLTLTNVEVFKDDASGYYVASIKNTREQKLVFEKRDQKKFQIVDSYGFFDIDPTYSEIAIKAGVPMKRLSDMTLSTLFKDDGDFMTYINETLGDVTEMHLAYFDGVYNISGSWLNIEQNIRNDGEYPVKGTDYDVVFHFSDLGGNSASSTKTINGVDLEPGETFTYSFQLSGYNTSAYYHQLRWTVTFNQKGGATLKDLLKKADFTGSEYADFVKEQGSTKKKKS